MSREGAKAVEQAARATKALALVPGKEKGKRQGLARMAATTGQRRKDLLGRSV